MISARELLSRHRIRCTRQREAIYHALVESRCHPTAEELYRLVKPRTRRLSLATVYNTLDALCRAGLARRVPTNGCCRYDGDMSDHLHVRIRETGEIVDVPAALGQRLLSQLPPPVLREIEQRLGVKVDGASVQLHATRNGSH
jgi:Fur family peroxide stress response transcriptional regulator